MRLKMRFKRATFLLSQFKFTRSLISAQGKVSNQHLLTHSVSGHFKWFNLNPTTTILWVGPIISALQMRRYESEGQQSVCGHTDTWRWWRRIAHVGGCRPMAHARLFPLGGHRQPWSSPRVVWAHSLTFPLRGPYLFAGLSQDTASCLTPRTTAPRRAEVPGLGSGGPALPQISEDEGAGPAPPGQCPGLGGAWHMAWQTKVQSGNQDGSRPGADTWGVFLILGKKV